MVNQDRHLVGGKLTAATKEMLLIILKTKTKTAIGWKKIYIR